MEIIKPPRLNRGDTIAVLSPSSGLPSIFPHVYHNGLKNLREKELIYEKEFEQKRKELLDRFL